MQIKLEFSADTKTYAVRTKCFLIYSWWLEPPESWVKCVVTYRKVHHNTSDNRVAEVMWYITCLFVCLLPGYLNKLLTDLNQILWNDRSSAKDQSVRFWDWFGSGSKSRIIFPFSSFQRLGVLGIKYELKELRMNVYETFWRDRPSVKNGVCGGLYFMSAFYFVS